MESKRVKFSFRACDKSIFDAIIKGEKKVETRAASIRFNNVKVGDKAILTCGELKAEKEIIKIEAFEGIKDLLKKYQVRDINPFMSSYEDLEKMYYSFPGYREKIDRYGLIAFTFNNAPLVKDEGRV